MKNKIRLEALKKVSLLISTVIICFLITFSNAANAQGKQNTNPTSGIIPQGELLSSKQTTQLTDFGGNTTGQFLVELNFFTNCYNVTAKMKAVVNLDTRNINVLEYSHFNSENTNDPVNSAGYQVYPKSEDFSHFKVSINNNNLRLEQLKNACGPNGKLRINASSWKKKTTSEHQVSLEPVTPDVNALYVLKSKAAGHQNIDVAGSATSNGTNVLIWGSTNNPNQSFHFVEAGDGYYRIETVMKKDMALDVYYAKTADQSNVNLWQKNGNNAQRFKLLDAGNGYVQIVSAMGKNLYLGVSDDNKNVVLRNGDKGDRILFKLVKGKPLPKPLTPATNTVYVIKSKAAGYQNVDVNGEDYGRDSGTNTTLNGTSNPVEMSQRFQFEDAGGGYYFINSLSNKRVLYVSRGETHDGNNIISWPNYNHLHQKFKLLDVGNGYIQIVSAMGENLYMGVSDDNKNVVLRNGDKGDRVLFKLEMLKPKPFIPAPNTFYVIKSKAGSQENMDVDGASNGAFAKVILKLLPHQVYNNQIFQFVDVSGGYYLIKSVKNRRVLDVHLGKTADGTDVISWDANETNAQKFKLLDMRNGYIQIVSAMGENLYLGVSDNHRNVVLRNGDKGDKVLFELVERNPNPVPIPFIPEPNTIYVLKAKFLGKNNYKNVDVNGSNNGDYAKVTLNGKSDRGELSQRFQFVPLGDGYYYIKSVGNQRVIDIHRANTEDYSDVITWNANGTNAQKFKLWDMGNGHVQIASALGEKLYLGRDHMVNVALRNKERGVDLLYKLVKVNPIPVIPSTNNFYVIKSKSAGHQNIDVHGAKTENGTNVTLYGGNDEGYHNQRFQFVEAGGGYYRIETAMKKDMALDVYQAKTADQSNVNLWQKNGNNAQKFKLLDVDNGYVQIVSALGNNLYLGVSDDNKNVVLRNGDKGDKLLFKLVKGKPIPRIFQPNTNLIYEISPKGNAFKYLTVENSSTSNQTNVLISRSTNSHNQKFHFVDAGDGYYRIETIMKKDMALDVYNAKTADQSNVNLWEKNGNNAQKFKLFEAVGGSVKMVSAMGEDLYLGVSDDNNNVVLRNGDKGDKVLFNLVGFSKPINPVNPDNLPGGLLSVNEATPPQNWLLENSKGWMGKLHDETLLSHINIPGTHDSGAINDGEAKGYAECQDWTIKEQLDAGVRFFDIRVDCGAKYELTGNPIYNSVRRIRDYDMHDVLQVIHGYVIQPESLSSILYIMRKFLEENPSEVIIIDVTRKGAKLTAETDGTICDDNEYIKLRMEKFDALGNRIYNDNLNKLKLGDVRGKIIDWDWAKGKGETIFKESNYIIAYDSDLRNKERAIVNFLKQRSDFDTYWLQWINGNGADKYKRWWTLKDIPNTPHTNAKTLNPFVYNHMGYSKRKKLWAWIMMDFPGEKLIYRIIQSNFNLLNQ